MWIYVHVYMINPWWLSLHSLKNNPLQIHLCWKLWNAFFLVIFEVPSECWHFFTMCSLVWGPLVNIVLLSLGNSCTEEPCWHGLQQGTPPGMSGDWGALSHHRQLHLRRRPHAQHLQDIQVRNSLSDIQCFGTNVMIIHFQVLWEKLEVIELCS